MDFDNATSKDKYIFCQPLKLLLSPETFEQYPSAVFLANKTLKRAKSFRFLRCSAAARLVAHPDLFHFSTAASFSSCFLTTPELAARGSFVRQMGVRVRCLYWYDCRGTPVVGPSIIARLWSMIWVMTAILPAEGPDLRRTTRPTWTKRLKFESAIVDYS